MNEHYSDYVKKNISPSDIVFEKVEGKDTALIKEIHKKHIRTNRGLLILLFIAFAAIFAFFVFSLIYRASTVFIDVFTLAVSFAILAGLFYYIYEILGPIRKIRKGIVLASDRIQEIKDNRNATYQYVFDIFLPDTDQTLMSYQVDREVFEDVDPGDGIVIIKTIRKKIKVLADPEREGIMDVSKIKSGVDSVR